MAGFKELSLAIQLEKHFSTKFKDWHGFEPADFTNLVEVFQICGKGAAQTSKVFSALPIDEVISRVRKITKLNSILERLHNNNVVSSVAPAGENR